MNKIFILIYSIMGYYFGVNLKFTNQFENLLGIFVCIGFSNIINSILYIVAYSITGKITSSLDGYTHRSTVHWAIRIILIALVMLIGMTGIYEKILTPYTHNLFIKITDYLQENAPVLKPILQ